ncbi:hypothetical protein LTR97_007678 [Elasticomyces elasticus]|uniref:Uncharacterized protein n=1 Tax=Elasticomyces elasticus TaxID=574655 RepID=A0AAN7W6U4_9PEZI|nr:hypothetical protein LTR97_007678 [Elasticomyces elasticus]
MSDPSTGTSSRAQPSAMIDSTDQESGDGAAAAETGRISPSMSVAQDEAVFHSAITAPEEKEEDAEYEDAPAEDLLPPPDFKPFFTLVEDVEGGEHHHPTVQYIFSDDDPEDLTAATLGAIDQDGTAEVEERVVLLDMDASGKQVVTASSLSPRWQALKVEMGQAPSWGSQGGDSGIMLKISGTELNKAASKQRKKGVGSMDELVRTFSERLDGMGEIMGPQEDGEKTQEM